MRRSGVIALVLAVGGALAVLLRPAPAARPAPSPAAPPTPPRPLPVPPPAAPPAGEREPASDAEPAPHRPRRVAHLLGNLVWLPMVVIGGVLTGLVAAALAPMAFGAHPMTVMSGSMQPAIDTGDVVVVRQVPPTDLKPGQVATFRDPKHRRLISHRVRGMTRSGGRVSFVTRGDANNTSERWTVAAGGQVGRVLYRIPKAGYVSRAAKSTEGRLGLVILPALLLGLWALAAIWRSPQAALPEPEAAKALA